MDNVPLAHPDIPATWAEIPAESRATILELAELYRTMQVLGRIGKWIMAGMLVIAGGVASVLGSVNYWLDVTRKLHTH